MNNNWFNGSCISEQELRLSNAMRLAWEQHVYWTRMTINSIAFRLPDLDATTARLLRNATDMGNLLIPFYGNTIAGTFSNLILYLTSAMIPNRNRYHAIHPHLFLFVSIVSFKKKVSPEALATFTKPVGSLFMITSRPNIILIDDIYLCLFLFSYLEQV